MTIRRKAKGLYSVCDFVWIVIKIGNKAVGSQSPTFIIAEIGSNHDRDLRQARELMDSAHGAGADAVKFQVFSADALYLKDDPYHKLFAENELPREWIPELTDFARELGVVFLASVFDNDAVDRLHEVNVPAYKIASAELTDSSLLKYTSAKMKPMILSTGMSDLTDIARAIDIVCSTGNREIIILHCTSLYPTKTHQVNLRAMTTIKSHFSPLPVGLSDHTMSITIPAAAVAMGACVIEKHITLGRILSGPDHSYALEPNEFKQMVQSIREVEDSLGSPVKAPLPEERVLDGNRRKSKKDE